MLGDERFRARLTQDRAIDTEIADLKRLAKQPTLDDIAAATATAFGIDPTTLYRNGRGRRVNNIPKMAALYLSRHNAGYPLKIVATYFKLGHYASVSNSNRRFALQLDADKKLAAKVYQLQRQLFGSAQESK